MNKIIIPAYEKDWKAYNTTNEEYIKRTTWSKSPEDVKRQLLRYSEEYVDEQKVKDFILRLANDEQLLAKASVVSDGSYRKIRCHFSATSYYIWSHYYFEEEYPDFHVSKENWDEFAIKNCEEFFIMFDEQKTRKRLHGIYEPDIMDGNNSYTAAYIKKWCEHHKDNYDSESLGSAYMLYNQIWGEKAGDAFRPSQRAFYFVEWNNHKGCYQLKRDLEKSPRNPISK